MEAEGENLPEINVEETEKSNKNQTSAQENANEHVFGDTQVTKHMEPGKEENTVQSELAVCIERKDDNSKSVGYLESTDFVKNHVTEEPVIGHQEKCIEGTNIESDSRNYVDNANNNKNCKTQGIENLTTNDFVKDHISEKNIEHEEECTHDERQSNKGIDSHNCIENFGSNDVIRDLISENLLRKEKCVEEEAQSSMGSGLQEDNDGPTLEVNETPILQNTKLFESQEEISSNSMAELRIEDVHDENVDSESVSSNSYYNEFSSLSRGACSKTEAEIQKALENTALGVIASLYESCSDSENEISSDTVELIQEDQNVTNRRRSLTYVLSSESDDSSDVEIVSVASKPTDGIYIDCDDEESSRRPQGPIRAKGEILLQDLPPIQDLFITVPEQECIELGKIHSIVEQLVLVDCIPGTVTLDLDTVLFLDKGNKVLGEIFDVIGQVSSPLYCVRFNSNEQIKERAIKVGQTVYVAPRTEHTRFLILSNLMSIRGSDASWENDVEPPEAHLDYSDDEEERKAKRSLRSRKQQIDGEEENEDEDEERKEGQTKRKSYRQHCQKKTDQRFQRLQQQRSRSNYNPQTSQQPSFQYNTVHTTWHANYSHPPPNMFPNPYSQQFNSNRSNNTPPAYYTSPNYTEQHSLVNRGNFGGANPNSSTIVPTNSQLNPVINSNQTHFTPFPVQNQYNTSLPLPPDQQINTSQFGHPGFNHNSYFGSHQ